ncbi:UDP-N-acetylmuramoyl-tripeptide--D-alanyl-D-alanine ligase [Aeromicrobium sp. CF3.5]|uniref:UDP-N-acetylmuramoyl-tripeptide--D-alanyl-D- alanine ligase n=1 Tax=Aeromicrobium sp. CF3.5 TaxID=3373078 RepID=UPI003EE7066E
MIEMNLADIAAVVGGDLSGTPGDEVVTSVVIDSRGAGPGVLFAALAGEHVDGHDFAATARELGAAATLGSRSVEGPCIVVADVTAALGLLARHQLQHSAADVVAITGSQGKTSVKDLLAHVLTGAGPTVAPVGSFNNELGVPLTVLRLDAETRFVVVEMGARGIGHIEVLCRIAPPTVGVVLNVGTAHVGEFGSTDAIAVAKGELVEALSVTGTAVLNADDPRVAAMAQRTAAEVTTFGVGGDVALGPVALDASGEPDFTLTHGARSEPVHIPQVGAHHAINAAAAAAAALALGLDLGDVVRSLSSVAATSPMRMARTTRDDGLLVINDAYNANPESMAAALRAVAGLDRRRHLAVLGEMLELGAISTRAHEDIGRLARDLGYDRILVVGQGAAAIADGAGDIATVVADVDVAVDTLSAWLTPDDVVVVKASRGCRLERVVDALLAPTRGAHAP